MIYIDKYAYFNKLNRIHPAEKFWFAVISLIITLSSGTFLVPAVVFFTMSFLLIFKAGIPFLFYLRLLLIPVYFLAAGVITIAVNFVNPGESSIFSTVFFGMRMGVTAESGIHAMKLFLRSLSCVSCLYFLTLTVPIISIITILRRLRIPPLFIELMIIIYRFIFVLLDTFDRIQNSQRSRLGYNNFVSAFRSAGLLAGSLFVISIKKTNDIYNALESRCYDGEFNFIGKEYNISPFNIAFIVTTSVLLILTNIFCGGVI